MINDMHWVVHARNVDKRTPLPREVNRKLRKLFTVEYCAYLDINEVHEPSEYIEFAFETGMDDSYDVISNELQRLTSEYENLHIEAIFCYGYDIHPSKIVFEKDSFKYYRSSIEFHELTDGNTSED